MPIPQARCLTPEQVARRLKLSDLSILAAAVECGSMARAAARLAMSQPAVSESIANLEAALGVRLVDRSPRGIGATAHAQALLRRTRAVFDELHQAVREVRLVDEPSAGEVRVAAGDTTAAGLLPAAIDRLSRRHPSIGVRVVQASPEGTDFRELRARSVDIALARLSGAFAQDDLDVEALFDDPHWVVVGARSPWMRRRRVALADLAGEPWLLASNRVVRELIAEAFAACGLPMPREAVTASSILLRNHLLATGRFVTVLPASVVRCNATRWSLKRLPIELAVKPRSVAMVTLRNRTSSPAAALFAEHLRAAARTIAPG